jgi:hypothetical protein
LEIQTAGVTRMYFNANNAASYITSVGTNPLAIYTNSAERMRIDSSGNVGIGTASPQSLLDLTGNDPTIRFTDNAGSPTATWSIRSNDANFSVRSVTAGADRMVVDSSGNLQFNSGYGSAATAYGCRAWVNFNGTGTVAIRASGNVSSITDRGVGRYTVNFTTAMVDVNYSTSTGVRKLDTNEDNNMVITLGATNTAYSTTAVALTTGFATSGSNQDAELACVAVFR